MATHGLVLLRAGAVTSAMIAQATGRAPAVIDDDAPRASGTLASHYAPTTPLRLVDAEDLGAASSNVAVWTWSTPPKAMRARWHRAPRDAVGYAHALYATLRLLDASGARAIWVERPTPVHPSGRPSSIA